MKTQENERLSFHTLSETFPMMTDIEAEDLRKSIKKRGLMNPITLFEGQILDGRNRYNACLKVGVEPKYIEYDGDEGEAVIDYIFDQNMSRRTINLTKGQRACYAAELAPKYRAILVKEGNARMVSTKKGITKKLTRKEWKFRGVDPVLGRKFNVNVTYVGMAKKILKADKLIFEEIKKGNIDMQSWVVENMAGYGGAMRKTMGVEIKKKHKEYLKSEQWQDLRKQALDRDGRKCQECGAENTTLDVHHRRYPRNWKFDKLANLITLCRECHYAKHPEKRKNGNGGVKPNGESARVLPKAAESLAEVIEMDSDVKRLKEASIGVYVAVSRYEDVAKSFKKKYRHLDSDIDHGTAKDSNTGTFDQLHH